MHITILSSRITSRFGPVSATRRMRSRLPSQEWNTPRVSMLLPDTVTSVPW
jgi:hypothetical protein